MRRAQGRCPDHKVDSCIVGLPGHQARNSVLTLVCIQQENKEATITQLRRTEIVVDCLGHEKAVNLLGIYFMKDGARPLHTWKGGFE